jgi:hypothetical protein
MRQKLLTTNAAKTAALFAAPVALTLATGAQSAHAQSRTQLALRLGVAYAPGSTAGNDLSKPGFSIGGSWILPPNASLAHGVSSLDIDYSHNDNSGQKVETFGVDYTVRHGIESGRTTPYVGLGLGIHYGSASGPVGGGGNNGGGGGSNLSLITQHSRAASIAGSSSRLTIGGKLLGGFAITNNLFFEASYNFNPRVGGVSTETLNFSLGVRF